MSNCCCICFCAKVSLIFLFSTKASAWVGTVLITGFSRLFWSNKENVESVFCIICKSGATSSSTGVGILGASLNGWSCITGNTPCCSASSAFLALINLLESTLARSALSPSSWVAIPLRFCILLKTRSAVPPTIPPRVNSSNTLSTSGSWSLYNPRAIMFCIKLAATSCNPSNPPDCAADFIYSRINSLVAKSSNAFFGTFFKILATGNISVRPTAPPSKVAKVSLTPPTSSPSPLEASIRSACWPIPAGIASPAGTPYIPALALKVPALASAPPTIPAPKKGTKEPNAPPSFVLYKSS